MQNPKVKTTEGQGVGAHTLAHNISGVEGRARPLGWGLVRMITKSIFTWTCTNQTTS
jgi:hypothetical protein